MPNLDLDAIEARHAKVAYRWSDREDVGALLAEVRRLRAALEAVASRVRLDASDLGWYARHKDDDEFGNPDDAARLATLGQRMRLWEIVESFAPPANVAEHR